MAKRVFILVFSFLLCLSVTGCLPRVSKTDQAENHIYEKNETIRILNKDTDEEFGTLTITKVEVLMDEIFEAKIADGRDDKGNIKYETVNYYQIIQVFYEANLDVSVSYDNFLVTDSLSETATGIAYIDPQPDIKDKKKNDKNSFIVGLKNKSNFVEIDYRYLKTDALPTATINMVF